MFHLSLTEPAAKLLTNNVQANNHIGTLYEIVISLWEFQREV